MNNKSYDVVIFGGGMSGTWLLVFLRSLGYKVLLFEASALGSGQTIASQGILHRGFKYLTGDDFDRELVRATYLSGSKWISSFASSSGMMSLPPDIVLSRHVHYVSDDQRTSALLAKVERELGGDVPGVLAREEFPALLGGASNSANLFLAEEPVIDVRRLLEIFSTRVADSICKLDKSKEIGIEGRHIAIGDDLALEAECVIFCAGAGNAEFARKLGVNIETQRRPLRMVVAGPVQHELYAHFCDSYLAPVLTVTTHPGPCDEKFWYIGGEAAEQGVNEGTGTCIERVKSALTRYLPPAELRLKHWSDHLVDRTEVAQTDNRRPSNYTIHEHGRYFFAWPTKLCLVPAMCDELQLRISRAAGATSLSRPADPSLPLEHGVQIAQPPWYNIKDD